MTEVPVYVYRGNRIQHTIGVFYPDKPQTVFVDGQPFRAFWTKKSAAVRGVRLIYRKRAAGAVRRAEALKAQGQALADKVRTMKSGETVL